jgi:hypothetical protein
MTTPTPGINRRSKLIVIAATAALTLSLLPFASVFAAVGVTPANATISVDTSTAPGGSSTFTTLAGPVISEGSAGDITPGGDLVLTAPTNWQFDTSSVTVVPTASAGTCGITLTSPVTATASTITTTIGGTATTAANRCVVTFSGIRIRPTTAVVPNVGTITVGYTGSAAITGLASGATVGTVTASPGAAILSFSQQPSSTALGGEAFATQPVVHSEDQFGNDRQGDTISLALQGGTTGAQVTCSPATASTNSSGNAAFTGCKIDKAGVGYTLRASTSGGSNTPSSTSITVSVGAADHLGFTSYPAPTTTTSLGTVSVAIQDKGNNTVTSASATITLAIGTNPSAGVLTCNGTGTGGRTQTTSSGVASLSCSIDKAGNGYTLTADDTAALAQITGTAFNVTSGPAARLALCWGTASTCNTTAPTGFTGGVAWPSGSQPQIRVQDANGNTVTSDNTTMVALSISTNPSSGVLTCATSLTRTVVAGVAAYTDCRIDKAGTGYRLQAASSPALTAATGNPTNAFNIAVGPAVKLGFTAQPGASSTATPFTIQPVVAIQDAGGNRVTTGTASTATVTLAIGTNPGGGTLSCTGGLTKAAVAGVATFAGCKIDKAGTGYTLVASATGLTSATSSAFNVSLPTATLTLATSQSITIWRQFVTLSAQLGGFPAGTGANRVVTFQRLTPVLPATWVTIGTAMTNANGLAVFSYGPPYNTQFRAVFAAATDLAAATSNTTKVNVRHKVIIRPGSGVTTIVRPGTRITYTATVRPIAPAGTQRVTFMIYKKVGGVWTFRTSATVTATNGVASFSWRWSRGEWYMRARGNATIYNLAALSPTAKVTAR